MSSRRRHNQVWIKVNAPVDEGVADLVAALNCFHSIQSFESCQGADPRTDYSTVHFKCGSDQEDHTARFVCKLAPALIALCGPCVDVVLEWEGFWEGWARASLRVQGAPKQRRSVARALRKLAREWDG